MPRATTLKATRAAGVAAWTALGGEMDGAVHSGARAQPPAYTPRRTSNPRWRGLRPQPTGSAGACGPERVAPRAGGGGVEAGALRLKGGGIARPTVSPCYLFPVGPPTPAS